MLRLMQREDDESAEELDSPSPAGLPQRLRAARRAIIDPATGRPLGMEQAATRIGVSKSTVQRWEKGENTPRDHWPDVERVYGKTRLELEFGLAGGEPSYSTWPLFLSWLETQGEHLRQPWAVDNLRRLRVVKGEISLEGYKAGLFYVLTLGQQNQ